MPMERAEPRRLGHYLLERRLAIGGMAEVFLAKDERDGRTVALKRLLPQVASDQDFLERFFHCSMCSMSFLPKKFSCS